MAFATKDRPVQPLRSKMTPTLFSFSNVFLPTVGFSTQILSSTCIRKERSIRLLQLDD